MIFVDSDNALGGGEGSVDDGFAIAALLLGGAPVMALSCVAGNAAEPEVNRNHRAIGALCRFQGVYLRSNQAGDFLARTGAPIRILALGPLSNIATAVRQNGRATEWCGEILVVGGNTRSPGRWPPRWPYEFNLTHDVAASRLVFESGIPWTVLPLNLLDRLSITPADLEELQGRVGEYLREHSQRRFEGSPRIRLGDLIAAMSVLDETAFEFETRRATMHGNGWIDFHSGAREIRVIRDFDGPALWRRFVEIINS